MANVERKLKDITSDSAEGLENTPKFAVTALNRRTANDDPKSFLRGLVEHIKETHCGVDCSECSSVW